MTKITKEEFENLPESLKTKFTADGDSYVFQEEDVEGLKKSKAEILKEKKELQGRLDELEKFKNEIEQAKETESEEKARKAGEFAELEKKLRAKIAEVEADRDAQIGQIMGNLKTERLKSLLIEKGVLPDRADFALPKVADEFDIERGEQGFNLKLKSGIGDPKEIDAAIEGLKSKASFLFAAAGASGSGASGSQQSGGVAKTATKDQVRAMSPTEKREFYLGGGTVQ
jgi:hypothetical protein